MVKSSADRLILAINAGRGGLAVPLNVVKRAKKYHGLKNIFGKKEKIVPVRIPNGKGTKLVIVQFICGFLDITERQIIVNTAGALNVICTTGRTRAVSIAVILRTGFNFVSPTIHNLLVG